MDGILCLAQFFNFIFLVHRLFYERPTTRSICLRSWSALDSSQRTNEFAVMFWTALLEIFRWDISQWQGTRERWETEREMRAGGGVWREKESVLMTTSISVRTLLISMNNIKRRFSMNAPSTTHRAPVPRSHTLPSLRTPHFGGMRLNDVTVIAYACEQIFRPRAR